MKITLAIPEGKKNLSAFIQKEINSCKNIKDKVTRDSVEQGLKKIKEQIQDSKVYLWNGKDLFVYDYFYTDFIYHCGSFFVTPNMTIHNRYIFLTYDANHATIGELHGKKMKTIWDEDSNVPRKHNKGGQSKERFQRLREQALIQWHKKIANKLKELYFGVR